MYGGLPSDSASQVTITPPSSLGSGILAASKTSSLKLHKLTAPQYGGLVKDGEGEETRKQLLARRRRECSAEEVDVALAPVLKINVPFVFYPDQYRRLRALFPRVSVDSGLNFCHHDHPVAHTATMIGQRYMQSMLKPGERVIDLHGNPTGNEKFNRFQESRVRKRPGLPPPPVIATMVGMRTAMDAVRAKTKWGPQYSSDGRLRWFESELHDLSPGCADVFFSTHTLYYYTMYDVCKFLNKHPNSKLVALVNYSPEQSGTLYGELNFSKSGGMTTQTSPNGERYHHPDIDAWFQSSSFRGLTETIDSGISWTSTCIGGPMYVLTITRCDWGLARYSQYDPPGAPTLQVKQGRHLFGLVKLGATNVALRITNAGLASELRHWMTFRDRSDPQVFRDLCTKARRVTGKDLVEGARQYEVADGDLQDHIIYAYLVDAPGEKELLDGIAVLKGDLLEPLAAALKFSSQVPKESWFSYTPFHDIIWGRDKPPASLGVRDSKPVRALFDKKPKNSGGLIPITRT